MLMALVAVLFTSCNKCSGGQESLPQAEIPILAWYSIPAEYASLERYQELKEAGFTINFSHLSDLDDAMAALDYAQQAGVKLIFTCGKLSSDTENTVRKVRNHPALYAYFLRDEPNNAALPALARWAERIRALDQNHPVYMNLFPNYVPEEALGSSYEEHVKLFIETVKPNLVSFDYYPITTDGIRQSWWDNLEVISRESAAAGLPFWAFGLSTAHLVYPLATMESLRLQFYTDLAYGAQCLQYFTYWTPTGTPFEYHDAPIDATGNRTTVYEMAKSMNSELQARAGIFMGCKVLQVRHTGSEIPQGCTALGECPELLESLDTKGNGAFISLIENGDYHYLMLVNRTLEGFDYDIAFSKKVSTVDRDGKISTMGNKKATLHLEGGDCAIFRWKKEL